MFCSKNEWDANDKNEDGMEKMQLNNKVQHVYLVGAKSLGAYGGYETFVYKLTEYHQNKENIKYHVACKANGDGCIRKNLRIKVLTTTITAVTSTVCSSRRRCRLMSVP